VGLHVLTRPVGPSTQQDCCAFFGCGWQHPCSMDTGALRLKNHLMLKNICEIYMFRHGRRQRFSLFFFVAFCWDHRDEFCILRRFYATCVYICSRKWRFLDPRFYLSGTDIVTQMQGTCHHDTFESHVFSVVHVCQRTPGPGSAFPLACAPFFSSGCQIDLWRC